MRLHPEGIPFTLITTIICLIVAILALRYCRQPFLKWALVALCVIVTAMMFMFFRKPDRTVTQDSAVVVAPSDGKVVEVRSFRVRGEHLQDIQPPQQRLDKVRIGHQSASVLFSFLNLVPGA